MKRGYERFLGNIEKCLNFMGMLFLKYYLKSIYVKICMYLKKVRWIALIHTTPKNCDSLHETKA